jgi:hypothetical protein
MFCPHSVFVCFLWISEQTPILSLYSINWLVFITEMECVYCAVRAESINVIQFSRCVRRAMLWPRPFSAEARVRTQVSPDEIYSGESATGTDFSPGTSLFPCQYRPNSTNTPSSSSYTCCSSRRTNGRGLGTFQKATLFRKSGSAGYKITFTRLQRFQLMNKICGNCMAL